MSTNNLTSTSLNPKIFEGDRWDAILTYADQIDNPDNESVELSHIMLETAIYTPLVMGAEKQCWLAVRDLNDKFSLHKLKANDEGRTALNIGACFARFSLSDRNLTLREILEKMKSEILKDDTPLYNHSSFSNSLHKVSLFDLVWRIEEKMQIVKPALDNEAANIKDSEPEPLV